MFHLEPSPHSIEEIMMNFKKDFNLNLIEALCSDSDILAIKHLHLINNDYQTRLYAPLFTDLRETIADSMRL
jgi:hypothetical protein